MLLVLASLGVVTLLTWMLLIDETDRRIDGALNSEIAEFARVTETGINPTTGRPYSSVDEILRSVIAANVARPNEKFLGYLDGRFRWESRRTSPRVLLREDPAFTALVADVRRPTRGSYESSAGEVRWSALPVGLAGDPQRGVIVIGYFTDREHDFAHEAARLMGLVGFGTALLSRSGRGWWPGASCGRCATSPRPPTPSPGGTSRVGCRSARRPATRSPSWPSR